MVLREEDGDVLMLEDPALLRKLALLLLNQEEVLKDRMTSEPERVKYLENCNNSYDGVVQLLTNSEDLVQKHKDSEQDDVQKIVEDIHHYITYFINMSLPCIRNCSLRVTCVNKIKTHFADLVKAVDELQPGDVAGARRLAEEVTLYKEYMWEYTNKCRSGSARALSKIFSNVIKQKGIQFSDLIEEYKEKLGFAGEFEELEEIEKLEVFNKIIEESGRATIPKIEVATASMGVATLVTAAALIAYDIFSAEYKLEAIVRNTLNVASEIGAFEVQVAVEGVVTPLVAEFVETAGVLIVAASGFIAGALAGLIFMSASGPLIDLIFNGGGKVEPHMIGMKFRKLDVPDRMAIANELAHDD